MNYRAHDHYRSALERAEKLAQQGKKAEADWLVRQTMQNAVAMSAAEGLYQAQPHRESAKGCSACAGKCTTPEACQLPIARATKPPRAAFWLDAVRRAWVRLHVALLRWNFDCIGSEREFYAAQGLVGAAYLRESYEQQRVLMTRIRELESGL